MGKKESKHDTPLKSRKKEHKKKSDSSDKKNKVEEPKVNLKRKFDETGEIPKKTSGYLIHCSQEREKMTEKIPPNEVMKHLGEKWKLLSTEEQESFNSRAKENNILVDAFFKEFPELKPPPKKKKVKRGTSPKGEKVEKSIIPAPLILYHLYQRYQKAQNVQCTKEDYEKFKNEKDSKLRKKLEKIIKEADEEYLKALIAHQILEERKEQEQVVLHDGSESESEKEQEEDEKEAEDSDKEESESEEEKEVVKKVEKVKTPKSDKKKKEKTPKKKVAILEEAGYPSDEAASKENLLYRLKNAGDYFLGHFDENEKIIGYVCGTLSNDEKLTHDSMFEHVKNGETLCIHSVVVAEKARRKGLGTKIMNEYLIEIKKHKSIKRIFLLCKENLISFYKNCGFELMGPSEVVHGQELWYDMKMMI
eukprot:gene3819-6980_t